MSTKPSAGLVRSMLTSHSVLGLTAAGLMYILCVSGTLAVFYKELERWEQPTVPEIAAATPHAVDRAANAAMAAFAENSGTGTDKPEHLSVTLPTAELPRLIVTADDTSHFAAGDGTLLGPVVHDWTHFLVYLHIAFNLPVTLGLTLVGIVGVMLVALIISGLLAHPNIFRDAFSLRMTGSERLGQVDLHNRLSVWGTPFHLTIALTGALIGLASVLIFVTATLFYEGDLDATRAPLFGQDPEPTHVDAPLANIGAAVEHLSADAPAVAPFYITVHEPGTTAQVVDVGAQVPRRVVWAELYRYDAQGRPRGTLGWAEGSAGAQIYASTFRLHFGHFGGMPVKLAYVLLGLSLCAVTATGVNVWIAKRRARRAPADGVERVWKAVLWGVPATLALTAVAGVGFGAPAAPLFWVILLAVIAAAWQGGTPRAWSRGLRAATAALAAAVVLMHLARFGSASFGPAALTVNLVWTTLAIAMTLTLWRPRLPRTVRLDGRSTLETSME